jgi:hypothetical protein
MRPTCCTSPPAISHASAGSTSTRENGATSRSCRSVRNLYRRCSAYSSRDQHEGQPRRLGSSRTRPPVLLGLPSHRIPVRVLHLTSPHADTKRACARWKLGIKRCGGIGVPASLSTYSENIFHDPPLTHFDSASYCALHLGLACDFFCCRHAMTLAMLVSDPLHSLNASPLQADCNAADGANPADAELGNTSRSPE